MMQIVMLHIIMLHIVMLHIVMLHVVMMHIVMLYIVMLSYTEYCYVELCWMNNDEECCGTTMPIFDKAWKKLAKEKLSSLFFQWRMKKVYNVDTYC
jgi:hypothetical protein